jgi:hypothetical protein
MEETVTAAVVMLVLTAVVAFFIGFVAGYSYRKYRHHGLGKFR